MNPSRLKALRMMPIFGGLTEESLAFLLGLAPTVHMKSGGFFFHEHQKGGSMYILEKGRVAVFKPAEAMGLLLAYLNPGDCFGEMELIDPRQRAASVLAVTDCSAVQISSACLLSLYKQNLAQFTLIQMNMCREISRRLRQVDSELFLHRQEAGLNDNNLLSKEEMITRGIKSGGKNNPEEAHP